MHENSLSIVFAVIGGFLSYCFDVSPFFEVLLWAMAVDLFVGVLASFIHPRLMFNSKRLAKGICKKIIILTLVAFSHQLDIMLNLNVICRSVTCFFIASDGLSILENAAKCGLPIPNILVKSLEQVKELSIDNEHKKR